MGAEEAEVLSLDVVMDEKERKIYNSDERYLKVGMIRMIWMKVA